MLDQLKCETHPDTAVEVEVARVTADGEVSEVVAAVLEGFDDGFELLDLGEEDRVGMRRSPQTLPGLQSHFRGGR